jgi:spore germination cell wall hydrolase CwlJ-like protein
MFSRGTLFTATLGAAALSGTLLVPASHLLASPAPQVPVIEAQTAPSPAPPFQPSEVPSPVAVPIEAPAPAAPPTAPRRERTAAASDRELDCMTKVILYESGSEPRAGQVAVAQVVMNRVRSRRFPNTICGVIYQRGQFSAIRSFNPPRNSRWQRAAALARDVIADGEAPVVGNALYFHAARVRPAYVARHTRVGRVGNHIFYR